MKVGSQSKINSSDNYTEKENTAESFYKSLRGPFYKIKIKNEEEIHISYKKLEEILKKYNIETEWQNTN